MQLLLLIPTGLLLGIQSIYDIRYQKIPTWTIPLGTVCGIATWIGIFGGKGRQLLGIIIGILALLFAKISRQTLGFGDGLVLCNLGIALGFTSCLRVILFGLCLGGIWALILIIGRKANRRSTMPFIPFLFLGYLVEVILGLC